MAESDRPLSQRDDTDGAPGVVENHRRGRRVFCWPVTVVCAYDR